MSVIGVVLAGGRSSRMGADKALLEIEKQSMLERTCQLLKLTSVSKVVVSRNDDTRKHIADLIPRKGPLSGIHSVAMRYPLSNLLVVPVDLPLMDISTIQGLIDAGNAEDCNVRYGKHSLPVFLQNSKQFRQTLDYTLRCTNCFSVDRLCSHFPLREINLAKQSSLFNTNSPAQWRFANQHFSHNHTYLDDEESHESFRQSI